MNELLDNEAEELAGADKYEHAESRKGYRSGHYNLKLVTTSEEVKLNIPKIKGYSLRRQSLSVIDTVKALWRKL